jgi:HPt (histidine-containing phosphotransfer) domain-containing protein
VTSPGPGPQAESAGERLQSIYARARASFAENLATIDASVSHLKAGALDEPERDAAERAAHRLAGAAGTVGYPEATAPARRLEDAFANDPRPDQAGLLQEQVAALHNVLFGGRVEGTEEEQL